MVRVSGTASRPDAVSTAENVRDTRTQLGVLAAVRVALKRAGICGSADWCLQPVSVADQLICPPTGVTTSGPGRAKSPACGGGDVAPPTGARRRTEQPIRCLDPLSREAAATGDE